MKTSRLSTLALLLSLSVGTAHAIPIDWRGAFGVDTTLLNSFRKIEAPKGNSSGTGTQEVPLASGEHAKASFQTYLFRLNPIMVVNDSATIKGEITSGYGRGGRLGDSGTESQQSTWGNALYYYNTSNDNTNLLLTKLYAELYSDTTTYVVGRQSAHWGMGILYNSGEGLWDRHTYVRDGITVKAKLVNFTAAPYYAVLNSGNSLTRATKSTEYGTTLVYDNPERDLTLGLVYAKRENDAFADGVKTNIDNTAAAGHAFGKTDVKITDIYLKKALGRLTLTGEFAMLNGDIGYLYNSTNTVSYKAKAMVGEANYKFNDSWKATINAGSVSGDSGARSSYQAMFLNPNYQIANILFRYNLFAVSDLTNKNIFDSYITNARFLKAHTTYRGEKWEWNWALIYALANEAARAGSTAYNHTTNQIFNATQNQSDKLGTEFDINATYHWNNDIEIGGSFGYLSTGEYWSFTNDATKPNSPKDSWVLQAKTGILF